MILDSTVNIWLPVDGLSGRDRGRVYAQRAHLLLGQALNDEAHHKRLFRDGRIRRKVLAGDIGCNRSALYENPQIRILLDEIEGRKAALNDYTVLDSLELGSDQVSLPPKVAALLKRLDQDCRILGKDFGDRIMFTDHTCVIDNQRYRIPTIILRRELHQEASDWLRHLVLTRAVETSTATQYAKILRAFLRYCGLRRRDWFSVDDDFLTSWRDNRRDRVDDVQVVSDLSVVFQFYAWAETTKLLSWHVGIYEKEEVPPGITKHDFPISARRPKPRKDGSLSGWVSTLTFRVSKRIEGRRNTPNDDQVVRVHEQLLKATHGERDALIAAWAEEAGPRRNEILQIRKSNLPSNEELASLITNEVRWEIRIDRRKRRAKAPLSANPYLLMQTLDWIDSGRQDIVTACRKKIRGYREPDEIFISGTTGKVLTPDAVTKIMGEAFKSAGVHKASLHRLRAKAIVEELEKHVDAFLDLNIVVEPGSQWAETILVRVAEMAGHASPASLRPYLNFVLSRRLSLTEADRLKRRAEKTRHLERRFASAKAWLEKNEAIMAAIRLTRIGKREEAHECLRAYIDGLSS